jgi:hypothetical protein
MPDFAKAKQDAINDLIEREKIIRSVYLAFDKKPQDDSIKFAMEKTKGINIIRLIDACKQLEAYNEFPKNLSREIINLSGAAKKDDLLACPKCGTYKDGVWKWHFAAGLQHHTITQADGISLYTCVRPCICNSGRQILAQWSSQGININTQPPECIISKTKQELKVEIHGESEKEPTAELTAIADMPF